MLGSAFVFHKQATSTSIGNPCTNCISKIKQLIFLYLSLYPGKRSHPSHQLKPTVCRLFLQHWTHVSCVGPSPFMPSSSIAVCKSAESALSKYLNCLDFPSNAPYADRPPLGLSRAAQRTPNYNSASPRCACTSKNVR